MGVDPVAGLFGLVIVAGAALALLEDERRKQQQEEDRRRRQEEEDQRKRDARRKKLREERERRENMEREELERIEREERRERRRRQEEAEKRRRWNRPISPRYVYEYEFLTPEEYYRSQPFHTTNDREYSFNSFGYDNVAQNRNCDCWSCTGGSPTRAVSPPGAVSPPRVYDPFSSTKRSVTLIITPKQTTPNKNKNVKNEGSSNKPTSSSSQDPTASTSTSKQNTNAPKNPNSGSDQSQRNNNNNNNNNNNSDKKDTVQDYGKLNDFMEILKAILDRCKVSKVLREKILAFFNKFEKHEENFLKLLEDFRIQYIAIEDIVSIVVRLFQSDYFAEDVAYPNFLALMEIVAKYLKDELIIEMVKDSLRGSKKSHEQQREECMKKVLQRENILSEITALFEKARKEIVEDNDSKPLNPDFSGIFAKVYHYIKHKVVRGKEWTVTEYFDWVRRLLVLLKNLTPEYGELSNVNHARRQIVFEMYSTAYGGYFRIVVRAYGPVIQVCTFFLREKRDKKAKDGDKYVDGKKKS